MNRRSLRENTFKLLYQSEFYNETDLPKQYDSFFKETDCSASDREYIENRVAKVREMTPEIDEKINKVAIDWKTTRMNKVDLAIIRLAIYEIEADEDVPTKVAVNEAVELAKTYSDEKSGKFVNGILAKFC